jgi:hypothetical protein
MNRDEYTYAEVIDLLVGAWRRAAGEARFRRAHLIELHDVIFDVELDEPYTITRMLAAHRRAQRAGRTMFVLAYSASEQEWHVLSVRGEPDTAHVRDLVATHARRVVAEASARVVSDIVHEVRPNAANLPSMARFIDLTATRVEHDVEALIDMIDAMADALGLDAHVVLEAAS